MRRSITSARMRLLTRHKLGARAAFPGSAAGADGGQRTGKALFCFYQGLTPTASSLAMAKAGIFILDLGTATIRHRALAKDIDRTGPGPVTVFLRQAHIESVVADALEGYAAGQSQPPVQAV